MSGEIDDPGPGNTSASRNTPLFSGDCEVSQPEKHGALGLLNSVRKFARFDGSRTLLPGNAILLVKPPLFYMVW